MGILSVVEIPGVILTSLAVERYSRKKILIAVMLIGGVSCTIAASLPARFSALKLLLSMFGKSNISGSFSLIYVFSCEILPTILRISGLGLCSVAARVGGMAAPYLLQLVSTAFSPYQTISLLL